MILLELSGLRVLRRAVEAEGGCQATSPFTNREA